MSQPTANLSPQTTPASSAPTSPRPGNRMGTVAELPGFHRTVFAALVCLMLLFVAGEARADPLTITVTNPTGTVTPGDTLNILVSAFNSGTTSETPVTITSFFAEYVLPTGSTFSVEPFDDNFNSQAVASGATLGPLAAFSITVAVDALPGQTVLGSFYFTYSGVTSPEATDFVVFGYRVVAPPPAAVPEPATLLLLGTGLAGVASRLRKRRSVSPDA